MLAYSKANKEIIIKDRKVYVYAVYDFLESDKKINIGDILVSVDGNSIEDLTIIRRLIEEKNVGDTVFTIGSPMSSDYAGTVTRGILSGKNRMVEVSVSSSSNDWIMNVMQTDAAINPGNSGGPLCNVSGEVIGVNSMKIVQSEIEGIGFAISIEDAIDCAKKIISGEEIKRAYLGISMSDLSVSSYYLKRENIKLDSSITSGVIVIEAVENGPCKEAGIEKGDVIVQIGKYNVKNIAELRYYLYKYSPKETIDIKIKRGKEEKLFKVTLGES